MLLTTLAIRQSVAGAQVTVHSHPEAPSSTALQPALKLGIFYSDYSSLVQKQALELSEDHLLMSQKLRDPFWAQEI